MTKAISILLALVLGLCPALASAHYLWIETDENGARIYFGEYNEDVREVAGGRLDERDALRGRAIKADGSSGPLSFTKQQDHFTASVEQVRWLLVEDDTNQVMDWTASGIGVVRPIFYARAAAGPIAAAKSALKLDLIPDATDGHRVQVFFGGQPLPNAKVHVHAPNLWSQELTADENGRVTLATPWPGQYVIEVIHKERKPGQFKGRSYEAIRHRVTFTHDY